MSASPLPWEKYSQATPPSASAPPWAKYSSKTPDQPEAVSPTPGFWDSLQREGKSLAGNIAGVPAAVYHAFAEPPTQEEKQKFGESEVQGAKRVGLGIHRLAVAPIETAADWYGKAIKGEIPNAYEQALSVAPEAMGAGAAAPIVGKLTDMAVNAPSQIAAGVRNAAATPTGEAVIAGVKQAGASAVRRIPYVGQVAGDVYDAVKNAKTAPVYRDATVDPTNIPEYAGEELPKTAPDALRQWWNQRGSGTVEGPIDRATMEKPVGNGGKGNFDRPHPGPVETLKQPVADVVDSAIPPENKAVNLQVKSKVEFYLQKGDVAGAEKALDSAAAKVNPEWNPQRASLQDELAKLGNKPQSQGPVRPVIKNGDLYEYKGGNFLKNGKVLDSGGDIADAVDILERQPHQALIEGEVVQPKLKAAPSRFPPERPPYAGDTNTIRASLPENVAKRRAELLDDQGIQQQMAQNLEQHGMSAESEARREFIARNSTGATKGDLIRQAGGTVPDKPVKYTKTVEPKAKPAPPPSDLTAILEESVRQAKLRKQAGGR